VGWAKLKPVIYMVLGFAIAWLLTKLLSSLQNALIIGLMPFIGLLHELLHLVASIAVKASYKFTLNGLFIGFKIVVKNVRDFIIIALMPQILSVLFLILFLMLNSNMALALMLIHVAISLEDLNKATKYLASLSP